MVCNQCGTENQDGVKFCAGCGNEVTAAPIPAREPAARPARAPKSAPVSGLVKILVAVMVVLALIFGVSHLFVDYVIPGKVVTIAKGEESKSYNKEETYSYKSTIYTAIQDQTLQEAKEALDEQGDLMDTEYKLKGSLLWLQLGNILGGLGCILVAIVGVLYLIKGIVPVYDMVFGTLFKGRTAMFVMGLVGLAVSVAHMILVSFSKIRYVEITEEMTTRTTAGFQAHWTIWAFAVICVVAAVYDLGVNSRKKK